MTAELLKDIITIFYTPLAQVYKAASIADSLGDLQNFLNDMIRTVEQVEECEYSDLPGRSFAEKLKPPSEPGRPATNSANLHRPRSASRTILLHLRPQRPLERSRSL